MKSAHAGLVAVCVALVSCATGCSQAASVQFSAPTIPTGEWSGRGNVVAYEVVYRPKDKATPKPKRQDGLYDTTLGITRRTVFGREALAVEIRSKRGSLLGSKDTETYIRMLLFRLGSLDKGGTLYSLANLEYGPSTDRPDYEGHKAEILTMREHASASCVRVGADTCLQVHYMLPSPKLRVTFADTFLFKNGQVLKMGSYAATSDPPKPDDDGDGQKITEVFWVERLSKIR